jgi:Ca2+-binding RTX toxin-like protein
MRPSLVQPSARSLRNALPAKSAIVVEVRKVLVALAVAAPVMLGAFLAPAAAQTPPPTCAGQYATIVGTDGDDILTGTDGDDVVSLGAGSDQFWHGGAGNDVVCGGPGQDHLVGEAGNDWLDGGGGPDTVYGGAGEDVVHGGAGNDSIHGDDFDPSGTDFDGADQVYGDDGDDGIGGEAGTGADVIEGGEGTDQISFYLGGGRSVTIDVAAGTATGDAVDTLSGLEIHQGSEYADVLMGSPRDDQLHGVIGDDLVNGRGGNDKLSARSGTIIGGSGRDTLLAPEEEGDGLSVDLGRGADRAVLGAFRNSTVLGGPGNDVFDVPEVASGAFIHLRGGAGKDRLTFARNWDRVRIDVRTRTATWSQGRIFFARINEFHGSKYADVLLGSKDADLLFGLGGDDVLKGRAGGDLLRGGTGRDTAHGGRGHDTCTAEIRFSCERR